VYEHIEYTPYGELWVERTASDLAKTPFRFTGKELDEETGLYYYGARYLNPQTSMWLSADPAMGEYIPRAPINDDARKYNQNLPGMGGVFNYVNLHAYHYAGNNPVKYVDPTGRQSIAIPLPIPWSIPVPNILPWPGTVLPPVFILPSEDVPSTPKPTPDGSINWANPPQNPDKLGPEWEDTTDPRNKSGNREFRNKETGEQIEWHTGERRGQGPHWHRKNHDPNTNKEYPDLDKDNNPVKEGVPRSHIYPGSSYPPGSA
jgi:RHS repeat-associated protein